MVTKVNVFTRDIKNWQDWSEVFQSIEAFLPLIKKIFYNEQLPYHSIENVEAGTNAVFKVGQYIIKLFVPIESGVDTCRDYNAEITGIEWALERNVRAPQLVAKGEIKDKYLFRYMILLHIESMTLNERLKLSKPIERFHIARKLRIETDKLNVPCHQLNPLDIIERELLNERWKKFSSSFNKNYQDYLKTVKISQVVYVHGDLNPDNILIDEKDNLYIIDFADGLLAPIEYEWALVMSELFHFDPYCLVGYFGKKSIDDYVNICASGLLIHDYGADVLKEYLESADSFRTIDDIFEALRGVLVESFIDYHELKETLK